MPEYVYFVYELEKLGDPFPKLLGEFSQLEHAIIFIEGYYNKYYLCSTAILTITREIKVEEK